MTVHDPQEQTFTSINEISLVQPPTHTRERHSDYPAVGWFKRKRAQFNPVGGLWE